MKAFFMLMDDQDLTGFRVTCVDGIDWLGAGRLCLHTTDHRNGDECVRISVFIELTLYITDRSLGESARDNSDVPVLSSLQALHTSSGVPSSVTDRSLISNRSKQRMHMTLPSGQIGPVMPLQAAETDWRLFALLGP